MHTFHPVDHLACWPPAYRFHDQSHCGSFCRRCQTKVRKRRFSTLLIHSRRFLPVFHPLHVYPAISALVFEKRSVGGLSSSKHCSAFLRTSLCERAVRIALDLSWSRASVYPHFYHIHSRCEAFNISIPHPIYRAEEEKTTVNLRGCLPRLETQAVPSKQ